MYLRTHCARKHQNISHGGTIRTECYATKACNHWRWCLREDESLKRLHIGLLSNCEPTSRGVLSAGRHLQVLALRTYSIRKLCYRLPSRWQIGAASPMGYSRTRRLRTIAALSILKSSCHTDRIFHRYTGFPRQRETQGKLYI